MISECKVRTPKCQNTAQPKKKMQESEKKIRLCHDLAQQNV